MQRRVRQFAGALVAGALMAAPVAAQPGGAAEGELHRQHATVGQLLLGMERAHYLLLEELLADPGAERIEGDFYDRVLSETLAGGSGSAQPTRLTRSARRLVTVLDRTYALQRRVYEIYSDESLLDKRPAVEAAVDQYLAQPDVALSPRPKSMEIMDRERGSMDFRESYPKTAGLFWAFRWLQLGGAEPLLVYRTAEERHTGIEATVARFREMVDQAPDAYPTHMPMAPTVAPEMVTRHPRAAAIFDNLNMMHDVITDILVNAQVRDKSAAIEETINVFVDPNYLEIDHLDWIRMSLRHGIYAQGGPAIGRLDRPERNEIHNHGAGGGNVRMQGM